MEKLERLAQGVMREDQTSYDANRAWEHVIKHVYNIK